MARSQGLAARHLAALVLLALAAATSSRAGAEEPRPRLARAPVPLDSIAAVVDDVHIFRSQVVARARHFEAKLSHDPVQRRAELAQLEKELLDRLVEETLLKKDARKLRVEVTDGEVAAAIETIAKTNRIDRKALEVEVTKTGFTIPEYEEEIRRQVLEGKWLQTRAMSKIDRKKVPDSQSLQAAVEEQRVRLLGELRSRAYVEIR